MLTKHVFALICNPSICNRSRSCLSPKNGCNIKSRACKTKKSSCGWEGEFASHVSWQGSTWSSFPMNGEQSTAWNSINKRLKFKTARNLKIRLEESMEYTQKFSWRKAERSQACTRLELETLGSSRIVPKNLPGHLVLSHKRRPQANIAMNANLAMDDDACHYLLSLRYMGIEWLLFSNYPILLGHETRDWYESVSKVHIEAVATFLIIFGVHMNVSNNRGP